MTLSRHRGATVVQLSVEDFGEVYSLRSVIEELAVRLAIRRRDEADLQALEQSLAELRAGMKHKITEQVAAQLDVNFHDNIFRAAHHERLYRSWSSIRMQVHWFLLLRTVASQDWREGMITSHSRILELIRDGDEAEAVIVIGAAHPGCLQPDQRRVDRAADRPGRGSGRAPARPSRTC